MEFLTSNSWERDQLRPTVHMSEDGICSRLKGKVGKGPDTDDMVTVAIRINTDTLQNIKVCAYCFFAFLYLTLSSPMVSNGCTSKCSGSYWSNPPFKNFLIFGHSGA